MLRKILCVAILFTLTASAAPQGCVGSVAIANLQLTVATRPGTTAPYLPIRQVNNINAGFRIRYQPTELPTDLDKDARLSLVIVPKATDGQITVLEPRPVVAVTEWQAPFDAGTVVFVFAPQGLDEKRLTNLVTRDQSLIAALADYADQTADIESSLETIKSLEDDLDDDKPFRPATPTEQALFALVRALNPAVSSFNPLGTGRRARAATLMGQGADAFFENAGGIVPGGGILPTVKTWLMPDTEFRAIFGRSLDSGGMALCAQNQPRSRNRMAYLWAYRLNGTSVPIATVGVPADIPLGVRTAVPLRVAKASDWRALERAYDWSLIPEGGAPVRVSGRASDEERALRLDLRKFTGAPGNYRIEARWDWETLEVGGNIRLHRLDSLERAQVTPESQSRLITGTGPVMAELTGADFVFVEKATLHRPGSSLQTQLGLGTDRANTGLLRVEIGTDTLRPGPYLLSLARNDGASFDVPINILPTPPSLTGGPLRVNVGEREQSLMLTGTGLDRIESLASEAADITLKLAAGSTRREATVRLRAEAKPGDRLALVAAVAGMPAGVRFPGFLQVAGARPRIVEVKPSLPRDLAVVTKEGELPVESWVSFAVRVEPAGAQLTLSVQCAEETRTLHAETLRPGEKRPAAQWTSAGESAWFLSLDPGAIGQSGCTLQAAIETEALGKSDPFALGKVVRLPRIESFSLTDEKSPEGFFGALRGHDLETIEKTGWSAQTGVAAPELPRPIAGEGSLQSLRIAMPWPSPSPKAPLFIWLRGESEGRLTRIAQ